MILPELTDIELFDEVEPVDVVLNRHIVYLHSNGTLILKEWYYEFSPRSHVSEGGFVVYWWGVYTSVTKIIREARAMGTSEYALNEFAERMELR